MIKRKYEADHGISRAVEIQTDEGTVTFTETGDRGGLFLTISETGMADDVCVVLSKAQAEFLVGLSTILKVA